jgi:transposase
MKLRVAYAKCRYKDKIYQTPLVVTSYRDENGVARNKTIASLAGLPDYAVKAVEVALKRGDCGPVEEFLPETQITYTSAIVAGPLFVALNTLKQLGIFEAVMSRLPSQQATALLGIVTERIIESKPLSVMAQQRRFTDSALAFFLGHGKAPALNTWYGALATLEKYREEILQELFTRNHVPEDLYLYDITSSYFEGETCPLAAYGYNRDRKSGKKQVVLGVICDKAGCPVWMDVFKGNTQDSTTVKTQLLNLRDKLGLTGFTFVGDRGMVTHARIEELEKEGWWEEFSYITALTRQEMMALVEDEEHPIQLELFDHKHLAEVEDEVSRYVLCHNPNRQEQDAQTRLRLLALTQQKLDMLKKNVSEGRLKKQDRIARRLYRWLNRWGMERFFTVTYDEGTFSYVRNEAEIERYSRLDGCYVIRSNVDKTRQDTADLRDRYKDLKYVEQVFRTMKTTDIQTRPIRHFNEPQVRGHFFACFLAYRVIWELRQRLQPVLVRDPQSKRCEAGSLAEIWREFETVTVAKLEVRGKALLKLSHVSDYVKKLLRLCKTPSLETILR